MKRHSFIAFLLLVSICCGAGTNAVTVPSVGDARLRIVGQNAENYLLDLTASLPCKPILLLSAKWNKTLKY